MVSPAAEVFPGTGKDNKTADSNSVDSHEFLTRYSSSNPADTLCLEKAFLNLRSETRWPSHLHSMKLMTSPKGPSNEIQSNRNKSFSASGVGKRLNHFERSSVHLSQTVQNGDVRCKRKEHNSDPYGLE